MKKAIVALLIVVVAAVIGGLLLIPRDGFSARGNPSGFETLVAKSTRRFSMPREARDKKNPVAGNPEVLKKAMLHFADHCATCHANNGSGATEMGRNMYPKAPDMRKPDTQNLTDGEIYYIIENGIRLTGMPAWGKGGDDDQETWALVHFIRHLPQLSKAEERQMKAANPKTEEERQEDREEEEFLNGTESKESDQGRKH